MNIVGWWKWWRVTAQSTEYRSRWTADRPLSDLARGTFMLRGSYSARTPQQGALTGWFRSSMSSFYLSSGYTFRWVYRRCQRVCDHEATVLAPKEAFRQRCARAACIRRGRTGCFGTGAAARASVITCKFIHYFHRSFSLLLRWDISS